MKKALVFDFGAVLVDWNPHYLFDEYFGSPEKTTWFLQNICTPEWNLQLDKGRPARECCEELKARYPEWSKEIDLYDEGWWRMMGKTDMKMFALLKRLKAAGFPLYGLTNWSAEKWAITYPVYSIFHLFDGIVVSGQEKVIKPDPEIFRILFDRYGLNPSECIFTDDRMENVQGARAMGMKGIVFTSCEDYITALQDEGLVF